MPFDKLGITKPVGVIKQTMKTLPIIILLIVTNSIRGYGQSYDSLQNETVNSINKTVVVIQTESLDTLILNNIFLKFDTIAVVYSPVPTNMHLDTFATGIQVFYNEKGIRKIYVNETWYYFENDILIMTYFICQSGAFMGLCNGLYSEYSNYFVNNIYYKTVEGFGFGQCHCSDNIILDAGSLEQIFLKFNEQQ